MLLFQILRGGVEGAEKTGKIIKADVVIGTSHALEDFACNDAVEIIFCGSLDVIGKD